MLLALVFLLAQQQASRELPEQPTPQQQQPQSDAELQKQLEEAIKADQQGAQKKGQAEQPSPPAPEPAVSGTSGAARPSSAPQTARGTQSLNPDISVILDGDLGWERRAPQFLNGDDPDLHGDVTHALGLTAQEVELAASAIVDPFFRGDVFLTIPNLEGIEVEEAFITTTSLPWNLQVKGGSFRSAFGRQNGQHLHVQDFTRRPLINAAFLGADGMRGPGLQISWLAPLPFFLTLYGEAFSLRSDPVATGGPVPEPVPSFGSDGAQMEALYREKQFAPFYSPSVADIPANIIPAHKSYVPTRLTLYVFVYNTRLVPPADVPKTARRFGSKPNCAARARTHCTAASASRLAAYQGAGGTSRYEIEKAVQPLCAKRRAVGSSDSFEPEWKPPPWIRTTARGAPGTTYASSTCCGRGP